MQGWAPWTRWGWGPGAQEANLGPHQPFENQVGITFGSVRWGWGINEFHVPVLLLDVTGVIPGSYWGVICVLLGSY